VIEDDVFVGPNATFTNDPFPRSRVAVDYPTTLVKRGASIGANTTIVCGHTIGQYAFIGAGAVVTKDVPDFALIVGNPGRIAGWMCVCGIKLAAGKEPPATATCAACATHYRTRDGILVRAEP